MNKDGGAAFPLFKTFPGDNNEMVTLVQPGMTIRQAYKMAALHGILSSPLLNPSFVREKSAKEQGEWLRSSVSRIADIMIADDAAHEKEGEDER